MKKILSIKNSFSGIRLIRHLGKYNKKCNQEKKTGYSSIVKKGLDLANKCSKNNSIIELIIEEFSNKDIDLTNIEISRNHLILFSKAKSITMSRNSNYFGLEKIFKGSIYFT